MSDDQTSATTPGQRKGRLARPPLFLVLIALLGYFLRFGYAYGDGDQDELIPAALRSLNHDLFATDWLIQYLTSGINVRTYFIALTAASGAVIPLWLGVALLHVIVWAGVAYGVYALGFELTQDPTASAFGMLVALVITPVITLGGNALVANSLVPETVAWALVLPGLALFLQRRLIISALLLGFATWFHLLAGGLTALVLCLLLFWRMFDKAEKPRLKEFAVFALTVLLVSLPIVIPVLLAQGDASPEGESPFYIHAVFRNPFHHLFFSFDVARQMRFWPLMTLGSISLFLLARQGRVHHSPTILRFWLIVLGLCSVSVLFVEIVPLELVAKLQFFKLTVPAALFASLLISTGIASILPGTLKDLGEKVLSFRKSGFLLALVVGCSIAFLGLRGTGRPGEMAYPVLHLKTDLAEVESWARSATETDALFAIPPTIGTFRSFAERSIVANWNAFVFDDRAMQIWYERLMAFAPISRSLGGLNAKSALDDAYHAQATSEWNYLAGRYGIDYVLIRRSDAHLDLPEAFQNGEWTVYALE